MIILERSRAQAFRAVLRRAVEMSPARVDKIPVLVRHGPGGVVLTAGDDDVTIMHEQPGPAGDAALAFPAGALGRFEGRDAEPVELTATHARWRDDGIPRQIDLPTVPLPTAPAWPGEITPMPETLLDALHEASLTTAREPGKFALTRLLLRGRQGQVVGTDTRQLLLLGGFTFPFQEDLLIPRSGLFGLPALRSSDVSLGRTATHLAMRVGPWSIAWRIDAAGRFPDLNGLIPKPTAFQTRLRLDPEDAEFLVRALGKRLPARDELPALTLDLTDTACVRLRREGQVVEIALPRSQVEGEAVRASINLTQFVRAIALRFTQFDLRGPDKPLTARGDERIYLFMPLTAVQAVLPDANALRLSPLDQALVPVRKSRAIAVRAAGTPVPTSTTDMVEPFDMFTEATALADSVARAAVHAGRLLGYLRGLCRQPQVGQFVRQSFQTLSDRIARSNP